MNENLIDHLSDAEPVLRGFIGSEKPCCGIVLGSGLNPFAETLENQRILNFADVPHLKVSTADGHRGRFVMGRVPNTQRVVLCMQGRLHGYEGNTPAEVAFPIWLMNRCGIDTLITTNAAGAINPAFSVGDFCLMRDQINLTGRNPLVGVEPNRMASRFVPMMDAFDPALIDAALRVADVHDLPVVSGVYLGLLGPSFETPAEIRAFAALGADTVAMSVVEEVIAARHCGMRVCGISLVSNMACGVEGGDPHGDDINALATTREADFCLLINGIVGEL